MIGKIFRAGKSGGTRAARLRRRKRIAKGRGPCDAFRAMDTPTSSATQSAAATEFAADWAGKGYEKGQTQPFWLDLLRVLGVEKPSAFIEFEDAAHMDAAHGFIDAYIPSTHVLIEQKSLGRDLRAAIRQSDGSLLTPFQQARRYAASLPYSRRPRWIVTCNFAEFLVHDMENPNAEPESIRLADLENDLYRLHFLVNAASDRVAREMEVSIEAGRIVGRIYDALLAQYGDPTPEVLHWLNVLCVRLVFCLYAEDAGIFADDQFHDYLATIPTHRLRQALLVLFSVLDTPKEARSRYLDPGLAAFPYVNGSLFSGASEIPQFTEDLRTALLEKASLGFDWSEISPTIFGAVFESTLNPETRRSGGMHYTSIENIHKVIDPLFLDKLRDELNGCSEISVPKQREAALRAFQNRLASLTFLDPACGSGNFLTETYLSLRKLENEAIAALIGPQSLLDLEGNDIRVKVSIAQFHGIEINDFAVSVAKTALWIAESQMLAETAKLLHRDLDFLPLKSYANIREGNALRMDWGTGFDYIIGNPPFVGHNVRNAQQKEEMRLVFGDVQTDKIDYVACWFHKAGQLARGTKTRAAFVATNSICQGVSVGILWKQLFDFGCKIDFAWPTFVWNSQSTDQAHVHVVVVAFSDASLPRSPRLLHDGTATPCANVNGYLVDAPDICPVRLQTPLCDVPRIRVGSLPRSSAFTITAEERPRFIADNPLCEKWIKPYVGSDEFINGGERYCLWLKNANIKELRSCRMVMERVEKVRADRLASPAATTRRAAATPTLFAVDAQPDTNYLLIPQVSSERRRYIPIGFMSPDVIASNLVFVVPDATLWHFGILTSNVHMAWMRTVAGRLKSDYRYGGDLVYNNFPWPGGAGGPPASAAGEPPAPPVWGPRIAATAQAILDARARHPDLSLADLYDPLTMPPELLRAHQANDRAVMSAYGFDVKMTESDCVAALFRLYEGLVSNSP